jgi:hypothetical protein
MKNNFNKYFLVFLICLLVLVSVLIYLLYTYAWFPDLIHNSIIWGTLFWIFIQVIAIKLDNSGLIIISMMTSISLLLLYVIFSNIDYDYILKYDFTKNDHEYSFSKNLKHHKNKIGYNYSISTPLETTDTEYNASYFKLEYYENNMLYQKIENKVLREIYEGKKKTYYRRYYYNYNKFLNESQCLFHKIDSLNYIKTIGNEPLVAKYNVNAISKLLDEDKDIDKYYDKFYLRLPVKEEVLINLDGKIVTNIKLKSKYNIGYEYLRSKNDVKIILKNKKLLKTDSTIIVQSSDFPDIAKVTTYNNGNGVSKYVKNKNYFIEEKFNSALEALYKLDFKSISRPMLN